MTEMPVQPVATATLYWRRHCPYCVRLRWQVRRAGLRVHEINIWEDAEAAARLRAITGGDETVPTLVVGSKSLVNPTITVTIALVNAEAPHLLDGPRSRGTWLRRHTRAGLP